MLILRTGLYIAVALAAASTWWSTQAGYSVEVAMLRGLLAFMAASTVGYIAELVVMTAPPPPVSRRPAADQADQDDLDVTEEPVSLPAVRAERDAADDRRAA